jgi:hypothetical protein
MQESVLIGHSDNRAVVAALERGELPNDRTHTGELRLGDRQELTAGWTGFTVSMAQWWSRRFSKEGRSKSEVARDYGVSRRWVIALVQRFLVEGEVTFVPRSRRPQHSPDRVATAVEDEIVALRKELDVAGHDGRRPDYRCAPRAPLRPNPRGATTTTPADGDV